MSVIREWWSEYFWNRTYRAQAAFRRGFWLGASCGVILDAILSKVL